MAYSFVTPHSTFMTVLACVLVLMGFEMLIDIARLSSKIFVLIHLCFHPPVKSVSSLYDVDAYIVMPSRGRYFQNKLNFVYNSSFSSTLNKDLT